MEFLYVIFVLIGIAFLVIQILMIVKFFQMAKDTKQLNARFSIFYYDRLFSDPEYLDLLAKIKDIDETKYGFSESTNAYSEAVDGYVVKNSEMYILITQDKGGLYPIELNNSKRLYFKTPQDAAKAAIYFNLEAAKDSKTE